jgi:hypothetical protein
VADQLFLSYRFNGYTAQTALRQYEKLLELFPWSRLSSGVTNLRIHAVSPQEPPLFETSFEDPPDKQKLLSAVREFACADGGIYTDTWWDLWQFDRQWQVRPSRVTLAGFAPGFQSGADDHMRIDFGLDETFLPQPELPDNLFMARSNVRSLLHLVHELDESFSVLERRLWTESGENFAERLQVALEEADRRSG